MSNDPLGGYGWLANLAIDWGFPVLATALGVPALAPEAAKLVKRLLRLPADATPETVQTTISENPEVAKAALSVAESEAAARWAYLTRAIEVQAEVAETTVAEVNTTIRQEAGTVSWWHWRHLLGYIVGVWFLVPLPGLAWGFFFPDPVAIENLTKLVTAVIPYVAVAAALLGAVAWDTTNRYNTAVTGERGSGGVMNTIRTVATGKRK